MRVSLIGLCLLLTISSSAKAESPAQKLFSVCNGFLSVVRPKKVMAHANNIVKILGEAKDTGGRRFFSVADIPETPIVYKDPHEKWIMPFWGEDGYLERMSLLFSNPIKKRWAKDTLRNFGVREKPSKILVVPLSLFVSTMLIIGAEHAETHNTVVRNTNYYNSPAETPFYDFYLTYDFRCRDIRDDLLEGKDPIQWSRTRVNNEVVYSYRSYFFSRRLYINGSEESLKKHLSNFTIFVGLKNLMENGVRPVTGYKIPESALGPLRPGVLKAVFLQYDNLAIKYEYITRYIGVPTSVEYEIDPALFTAELKREIEQDSFNRELITMQKAGEISLGQLLYGMEANEWRKTQFKIDGILHIVQQKQNPDGSYSDMPLTLEEAQEGIKDAMFTRPK
jgi:hypothetical protein